MAEYKVKFEVFEGPLDLLLYLIKKEEVDIYEVNLTKLATQFIEYIETMRLLDLEVAGEFLVMASTLMYIKSRELLPVEQQAQVEGEEEGEDPRWELIRQLVAYKKFKDAAAQLHELEVRQENTFPRVAPKPEFEDDGQPRHDASIFDLVNAVNAVLKRFGEKDERRDIFEEKFTVSQKIEDLLRLTSERTTVRFSTLFEGATSRPEVIVTFLALLELIRLKQLVAQQQEAFGEIEICRAPVLPETPPATEPAPSAEATAPQVERGIDAASTSVAVDAPESAEAQATPTVKRPEGRAPGTAEPAPSAEPGPAPQEERGSDAASTPAVVEAPESSEAQATPTEKRPEDRAPATEASAPAAEPTVPEPPTAPLS